MTEVADEEVTRFQQERTGMLEVILRLDSRPTYGFHLARVSWEPFPRIRQVEEGGIAQIAGVRPGDLLVSVNHVSLLGAGLAEIVGAVATPDEENMLTLGLWRSAAEMTSNSGSLRDGEPPLCGVLALLGCPVCSSDVAILPRQCRNGHVICTQCALRTQQCPICRVPLGKPAHDPKALPGGRCLLAEQVSAVLQTAGVIARRVQSSEHIPAGSKESTTHQLHSSPLSKEQSLRQKRRPNSCSSFAGRLVELCRRGSITRPSHKHARV